MDVLICLKSDDEDSMKIIYVTYRGVIHANAGTHYGHISTRFDVL